MKNTNNTKKAIVKGTQNEVQVYKLKSGDWCVFLGEGLTMSAVNAGHHQKVYKENELQFI